MFADSSWRNPKDRAIIISDTLNPSSKGDVLINTCMILFKQIAVNNFINKASLLKLFHSALLKRKNYYFVFRRLAVTSFLITKD